MSSSQIAILYIWCFLSYFLMLFYSLYYKII